MGAHSFTQFAAGVDPHEVYKEACARATDEYGHDGYNGTISTTSGVHVVSRTPVLRDEAERVAARLLDDDENPGNGWRPQKWESAGALAIADPASFKLRERTVTVTTDKPGYLSQDELIGLVRLPNARPGERIVKVTVEADERKRKLVQDTPVGKAVTSYQLQHGGRVIGTEASMKDARAAAKAYVAGYDSSHPGNGPQDVKVEIVGSIRREGGAPLIVTEGRIAKRKLTLKVELATPKPGMPKLAGWLLFGWAAS